MRNRIQSIVLAFLGLYLVRLRLSGELGLYLHSRFHGLILAAGLVFIVLSIATLMRRRVAVFEAEHGMSWSAVVVIGIALLMGVGSSPRTLGSRVVARQSIHPSGPARSPAPESPVRSESEAVSDVSDLQVPAGTEAVREEPVHGPVTNLYEAMNFIQTSWSNIRQVEGVRADVIGFVYREPEYGETHIAVTRFLMVCCVADLSAQYVFVRHESAPDFEPDTWVRVRGEFRIDTVNWVTTPALFAESIEVIEPPSDPYLYPPDR